MASKISNAAAILLVMALGPGTALAQRQPYGGFDRGPSPFSHGPKIISRPGMFDYYALVLSWSPSYCASSRDSNDLQCQRRDGRRFAFVLHGLWPQFEKGWPQDCPTPDRGFVPRPVAQHMLDIMPSEKLVFHEYRKHGVCSGLNVDAYFDLARQLFSKIKIPERYQQVNDNRLFVSPGELVHDFIAANPQMKADMIAIECGGPGNRLKQVRVCFDRGGEFRACGRNEDQKKMCAADRIFIPPMRAGAAEAPSDPRSTRESAQYGALH
jgi:ribonuclease T2